MDQIYLISFQECQYVGEWGDCDPFKMIQIKEERLVIGGVQCEPVKNVTKACSRDDLPPGRIVSMFVCMYVDLPPGRKMCLHICIYVCMFVCLYVCMFRIIKTLL